MQALTKLLPKVLVGLAIAILLSLTIAPPAVSATALTAHAASRQKLPPALRPRPTWDQMNVPQHSAWAKNVLLIVVWMFVLAVLAGPLVRYLANRKPTPRPPAGGAW